MTDPRAALTALICEHSGLTGVRAERLAERIADEWAPEQCSAAYERGFSDGEDNALRFNPPEVGDRHG